VKNTFAAQTHNANFGGGGAFGIVVCHSASIAAKLTLGPLSASMSLANFRGIVFRIRHSFINKTLQTLIFRGFKNF